MVQKINNIINDLNKNINNLDKIQRFTIKANAENFLKNIIEIPIIIHYEVAVVDEGGEGG